jgi:hypothetical protein
VAFAVALRRKKRLTPRLVSWAPGSLIYGRFYACRVVAEIFLFEMTRSCTTM